MSNKPKDSQASLHQKTAEETILSPRSPSGGEPKELTKDRRPRKPKSQRRDEQDIKVHFSQEELQQFRDILGSSTEPGKWLKSKALEWIRAREKEVFKAEEDKDGSIRIIDSNGEVVDEAFRSSTTPEEMEEEGCILAKSRYPNLETTVQEELWVEW